MQKEEHILGWWGYLIGLAACVVGYALSVLFRHIWPVVPLHCADGWQSLSIGIRGACSHHGGVVGGDTMPWIMYWVPPITGFILFAVLTDTFGSYKTIKYTDYGATDIGKRGTAIDRAIQLEQGIEFVYTKKGETHESLRRVRPIKVFYLKPGIFITLCVSGYCYSKAAERTFSLAHMTNLKIVELA